MNRLNMNRLENWTICLCVLLAASSARAEHYNVFFAGGQSNAKAAWAEGIQQGLIDSGLYENVLVINRVNSGNCLLKWVYENSEGELTRQENYGLDLFAPDGTGHLQTELQSLTDGGHTYDFQGFFWWQGECDAAYPLARDRYPGRFLGMLSLLADDLGIADEILYSVALIDADAAYHDTLFEDSGRTVEDVEAMRAVLRTLGELPRGSYLDTRGYERLDAWHPPLSELRVIGQDMAAAFIASQADPVPMADSVPIPTAIAVAPVMFGWVMLRRRR